MNEAWESAAERLLDLCREASLGVDQKTLDAGFEWSRHRCIREIHAAIEAEVHAARMQVEAEICAAYDEGHSDALREHGLKDAA